MVAVRRGRDWLVGQHGSDEDAPLRDARMRDSGGIAVVVTALLAGLFMGSATADRYMPRHDGSTGYLAYVAHYVRQPDGTCAAYVLGNRCVSSAAEVRAVEPG